MSSYMHERPPTWELPARARRDGVTWGFALFGLMLLVWVIAHTGPARLAAQLVTLAPILPFILGLTALRYLLQAASWRVAIPKDQRPPLGESFAAILAGEALTYLSWAGPVAGEPTKAVLVRHRLPVTTALAASFAERAVYALSGAAIIVTSATILAVRARRFAWLAAGAAGLGLIVGTIAWVRSRPRVSPEPQTSVRTGLAEGDLAPQGLARAAARKAAAILVTMNDLRGRGRGVPAAMIGFAMAQQTLSVLEAYVLLSLLGAEPNIATAILFEGVTKVVNAAGLFVPGRIGVYEGASAVLGDALRLGAAYGLGLALARRVRALIWGIAGIALLGRRAAHVSRQAVDRHGLTPASAAFSRVDFKTARHQWRGPASGKQPDCCAASAVVCGAMADAPVRHPIGF